MRLIDADAILQDVQEQIALTKTLFPDEEINLISKMLEDTFKRQIEKMPTVEAIPIEWVKQYISRKIANDTTMFHWWSIFATDCKNMYEDWRAENEID